MWAAGLSFAGADVADVRRSRPRVVDQRARRVVPCLAWPAPRHVTIAVGPSSALLMRRARGCPQYEVRAGAGVDDRVAIGRVEPTVRQQCSSPLPVPAAAVTRGIGNDPISAPFAARIHHARVTNRAPEPAPPVPRVTRETISFLLRHVVLPLMRSAGEEPAR